MISSSFYFNDALYIIAGICLASSRDGLMFENATFCSVWGVVWEFIPYYSVFLVFWLSILRTFALLKPLEFVHINKRVVIGVLIGYAAFLMIRQLFGVIAGYSSYKYEVFSGYCWNHISNENYQVSKNKMECIYYSYYVQYNI